MMAFEPIIIEMRRVGQSGSVSQTGPHSQECGHEALFCVSLPSLLFGMLCLPTPKPVSFKGTWPQPFWSAVEATQVHLCLVHPSLSLPSLVVLDFVTGQPGPRKHSVPRQVRAPPASAGTTSLLLPSLTGAKSQSQSPRLCHHSPHTPPWAPHSSSGGIRPWVPSKVPFLSPPSSKVFQ